MAANRYRGPEHWPRRRWAAFRARLPFMDGAGCAGRWLAAVSRTEAVPVAPSKVLEDGSKERAKKDSKKTYEIFLGVSGAFGA